MANPRPAAPPGSPVRRLAAPALLGAALLTASGVPGSRTSPAAAEVRTDDRTAPLEWNAQGGLSCTPSRCIAHKFVASQGTMRIKADEAEGAGLNVENSHWTLTGNLEITLPQGQLRADRCDVQFDDRRVRSAHCTGNPASFEQPLQAGRGARGRARDIDYDVARDEVQLTGDAWLTDGCNEISTEHMTYNLLTQGVEADSPQGGDQRVRGTVRCRNGAPPGPAADGTRP
jgi:lipopolysaccharide transport protein LptA